MLAAARINSEQLGKLSELILEQKNMIGRNGFADIDYEFHRLIAEATNNPLLIQIYDTVASLFKLLQNTTASLPRQEKSIGYHQQIYQAIYEWEAERAVRLMREHILDTRKRFIHFHINQRPS